MKKIFEQVLPGKTGAAMKVYRGQHFRVVDLEGQQICDMALFNLHNYREKLSTSYSRTRQAPKQTGVYIPGDRIEEGFSLLSTICRPMMTIVKETAPEKGVHDCHNRMCNRFFYEVMMELGPIDGCHEIISDAVKPFGLLPEDIPDTFDINMNFTHDCTLGQWVIKPPVSRPGDFVEFRAEMDCLVAVSVCPNEAVPDANGGKSTPMRFEIYAPQ